MKKIAKIFGAFAAVSAVIVGGVALYKKFFSLDGDLDDLDEDLEDEFEDEDLDAEPAKAADRSYVSLTPSEEQKEETPAKVDTETAAADETEVSKDAAEADTETETADEE
ncbi:hypothetical protein ACTNCH_07910 [Candidatus Merdisoma sp. HCP28S3_D10]|uniref:hypothetical protein n=1 Tax=unclassified Candidatus Merdisoma TaxID=3099611 RepID=UPI003F8C22E9